MNSSAVDYVAEARTAYQEYVDESAAAYRRNRAGLATARGGTAGRRTCGSQSPRVRSMRRG